MTTTRSTQLVGVTSEPVHQHNSRACFASLLVADVLRAPLPPQRANGRQLRVRRRLHHSLAAAVYAIRCVESRSCTAHGSRSGARARALPVASVQGRSEHLGVPGIQHSQPPSVTSTAQSTRDTVAAFKQTIGKFSLCYMCSATTRSFGIQPSPPNATTATRRRLVMRSRTF